MSDCTTCLARSICTGECYYVGPDEMGEFERPEWVKEMLENTPF